MEDLLARLLARIDRHSPGRVLVLVRGVAAARWLQSLLVERATLVGVRVLDPDALLSEATIELAGPGLPLLEVLAGVRRSLALEFAALADHPGYQRELLSAFVELERVLALGELDLAGLVDASEPESRDRALLDAFVRFRADIDARLLERGHGWWRGQALARVLAGHERAACLRRRAAAIAIGFEAEATPAWERALITKLGFESWPLELPGRGRGALAMRLECAGPEAEIAAVARMLRASSESAAVLAPAEMIARWAARLRHRDVPVRAWVTRPARLSAAARITRALLRIAEQPLARRGDLDALLFGPTLRAWTELPEGLELAALRKAWDQQRWSAISLAALVARLQASERPAELAIASVIERLDRWRTTPSASELEALLDDWQLVERASLHGAGVERKAARTIVDTLARLAEDELAPTLAELGVAIDHALSLAQAGEWIEQTPERGPAAVWLLPYDAVLDRLPERVFMTGLDRHPTPRLHAPLSDELRERIGLVGEARRFGVELRRLDAIVATCPGRVIASHRRGDGAGNELAPGPWIAGRQDEHEQGQSVAVGVDAIALAVGEARASAPIERELIGFDRSAELSRRVEAIHSHESAFVGPHTGALGVTIAPAIYSASSLQSYAQLPFRYFVERVLGLGQRETREAGAAGLLSNEQGQVVHQAIDRALADRLAGREEPLELASITGPLLDEVLAALDAGYRKRAEHGQAEAIWASERDRWVVELSAWWDSWATRLRRAWGPNEDGGRREADELVPAPFVLASEWSPSEGFELELGPRTIPFAAAIDRIEIDPMRQRVNVCDYKTGMPQWPAALLAELRAGTNLQLGLYALAVEQVMRKDPAALRLPAPISVGALRLEYLKRPPPRSGSRPAPHVVRGFVPTMPLGLDARGNVWSVVQAAAGFTLAFVSAIEGGYFPVVGRTPPGQRIPPSARRIMEVARVVPSLDRRATGLPGVLGVLGAAG